MMFKDEFQLDFINVEELGMREEEVDERVIENKKQYCHEISSSYILYLSYSDGIMPSE
jgi:hypothetical protein